MSALVDAAVRKFGPRSVEELIADENTRTSFQAPAKTKFISGPGFAGHVHVDSEMLLHLPNGATVRVHTDASQKVTHVEEDDHLHAIVRPDTHRTKVERP